MNSHIPGDPDLPPTPSERYRRPRRGRRFMPAWIADRRFYRNINERLRDPSTRTGSILALTLAAGLVIALIFAIGLAIAVPSARSMEEAQVAEASIAYTADGEVLTRYQIENRTWVPLDSVSQHVIDALIATEDRRFYDHWGVDFRRTGGAFFKTLGGDKQGGSTITMQLARNAFPKIGDDFVILRKMKEWLTAIKLEDRFAKEDILEMYLNTVPFMYNAFGIEAAAHTYFQKPASALTVAEAATLVGMLKGTVLYNPVRNPENSHERRNVVLQNMVEEGSLAQAEYAELADVPTGLNFRRLTREDNMAPYFAEHIRQWLAAWAEDNGYNPYTDGLRVYTTLDSRLQEAANEAVREVGENLQAVADVEWSRANPPSVSGFNGYKNYRDQVEPFAYFWQRNPDVLDGYLRQTVLFEQMTKDGLSADSALTRLRDDAAFVDSVTAVKRQLGAGFVAIDPRNGHVLAWVGGRDFAKNEYDHVAQAKRQPGSTFKPFVYAAALERGYSPNDMLRDEVVTYRDPDTRRTWRPTNVGSATGQLVTLRDALAYSKNTITAQLTGEIGPDRVASMARRMGIESELDEVPSIGLGTSPVTLLEMTAAYTAFAENGQRRDPVLVTRIESRNGAVLATFDAEPESVVSAHTAYTVLDMMRGVVDYGTGQRIRSYGAGGDFAGKTGTSQDGADGWFMLLHPHLVMGAWVGFDTPRIHFRSSYWGQGAHNALLIVGDFYRQARRATDVLGAASFEPPPGYVPPPPPDSSQYALGDTLFTYDDAYYDSLSARYDSLRARTDSLLRGSAGDYLSQEDSLREPREDVLEMDSELDDLDDVAETDEPLSKTDSLNRAEANKPLKVIKRQGRSTAPQSGGSTPRSTPQSGSQQGREQHPPPPEDDGDSDAERDSTNVAPLQGGNR